MDSLPKLLPVWSNAAEHALADLIDFSVASKYQPDFGGAGVDIETDESGISRCLSLKCHDSRQNKLSARYLTLPFTVPNEVTGAVEPCLQYQLDLNQRIRAFESTISNYRGIIKRKGPFSDAVQKMTKVLNSKKAHKQLKNTAIHQSLLDLMQAQPESFCYRVSSFSGTRIKEPSCQSKEPNQFHSCRCCCCVAVMRHKCSISIEGENSHPRPSESSDSRGCYKNPATPCALSF